jgi:oligopeptidase B
MDYSYLDSNKAVVECDHDHWQSVRVTTPPRADQRPHTITRHDDDRVDPYYWLMDRDSDDVIALLTAENEYLKEQLAPQRPLEDALFDDIKSRIEETDTSVPVRNGAWWHFERTREGLNYAVACRAPVGDDRVTPPVIDPDVALSGEEVVFDENAEADGHDFLSVGVLAISPDDRWVAVGTDFEGNERHTLTVRPLDGQEPLSDEIHDVYYGFAWATDSRHFFYTTVDDAMRPWRLWRHELGTLPAHDLLVYQEDDAQYNVSVGRSRDDQMIMVFVASSTTTEVHSVSAANPTEPLTVLEPRRNGIEYATEHYSAANGEPWWLKITNEDATDFRLLGRRLADATWREIVPHRPGTRLDGVDAFAGYLALSERLDGCASVRLVTLIRSDDPFGHDVLERSRVVSNDVSPSTVALSSNPNFDTEHVRVVLTSMITPRVVADVVAATGDLLVRKQQRVLGNFRAEDYATGRLWVTASDGVRIPVSVVARKEIVRRSDEGVLEPVAPTPLLLYGYGSYEISIDPTFSSIRLALLDRGVIFAIAHVRGGGEMGRSWYEMGKLAQKPTTFSDFVAVARHLVDAGWTTPVQLAARGGSAGGLLMGAAMNLAPELFRCVVAEVPFVDALTTMLDDSLPLTVGEWEEWGNPDASATAYRTMKSYSPYDNVRGTNDDGSPRRYPAIYATGGLNDSRVGFWEPAKWVQKLRDVNADNKVVLKMEMGTGHGGPSGRYDAWRDEAQVLAFVVSEIVAP